MLQKQQKGDFMKNYIEIIGNSKLFVGIDDDEIISILNEIGANNVLYKKGSIIFSAGNTTQNIFMVLSGKAHIERIDFWGNRTIISNVEQGEVFAESYAVLDGVKSDVEVIAMEDTVILLLNIDRLFESKNFEVQAKFFRNFLKVMAYKNYYLTKKVRHLTQKTTRNKILSYLSDQSVILGKSDFVIPYNRQQLADYLSIDRSAMSKELSNMKAEGILDFRKNRFILKNHSEHLK